MTSFGSAAAIPSAETVCLTWRVSKQGLGDGDADFGLETLSPSVTLLTLCACMRHYDSLYILGKRNRHDSEGS